MHKEGGLKKNLLSLIVYLLLAVLVFVFDQSAFLNTTKSTLLSALRPFFFVSENSIFQITRPFEWLAEQQILRKEVEALRAKTLTLVSQKSLLVELENENAFLKKALNIKEASIEKVVVGRVVGRSSEEEQSIIIDIGSKDGVREGSVVTYPENYLLGKVVEVYSRFSRVSLITNSNISIASIGQTSRTDALCQGRINHLEIEVIDYQKKPIKGEIFITSGIDGYPSGLILGRLEEIIDNPVAISRIGELEIIINPNFTKKVMVILGND